MKDTVVGRRRGGFTLIEVLVVIAIIALLISILLPGLGRAKKLGLMVKEMAALKEQQQAYNVYTNQFKDRLLPGGPRWDWAHGGSSQYYGMTPPHPIYRDSVLEGSVSKFWTWHFFSTMDYPINQIMLDKPTFEVFNSRAKTFSGGRIITPGDGSWEAAFDVHPSFGYNGIYVGGHYRYGAFQGGIDGTQPATQREFYVRQAHQIKKPSDLIIFASSRGGDVTGTAWWSYGAENPDSGTIRPGYFLIKAPTGMGGGWTSTTTDNIFNTRMPPSRWGNMDARHDRKVSTSHFDGHVEMQTIQQLRWGADQAPNTGDEMRKWSNDVN